MVKVCRLPGDGVDAVDQFTDEDVPRSGFVSILYWSSTAGAFVKHEPADPDISRCGMVHAHHPDCECATCKAHEDERCLKPTVGWYTDGRERVCGGCAKQMESEGFEVIYDRKIDEMNPAAVADQR
jgi:hypothetical protein